MSVRAPLVKDDERRVWFEGGRRRRREVEEGNRRSPRQGNRIGRPLIAKRSSTDAVLSLHEGRRVGARSSWRGRRRTEEQMEEEGV